MRRASQVWLFQSSADYGPRRSRPILPKSPPQDNSLDLDLYACGLIRVPENEHPLRLVVVEDNEADVELLTRCLIKAGLDVVIHRVETSMT